MALPVDFQFFKRFPSREFLTRNVLYYRERFEKIRSRQTRKFYAEHLTPLLPLLAKFVSVTRFQCPATTARGSERGRGGGTGWKWWQRQGEPGISQNLSLPTSITVRDSLARRFNVTQAASLFSALPKRVRARARASGVSTGVHAYTRRSRNTM